MGEECVMFITVFSDETNRSRIASVSVKGKKESREEKGLQRHSKLRTCSPLVESCGAYNVHPELSAFIFLKN